MEKTQEPQIDLDAEYRRISEIEKVYNERIGLWGKLTKIIPYLALLTFIPIFISLFSLPERQPIFQSIKTHPLQAYTFLISFGFLLFLIFSNPLFSKKRSQIENELGLPLEERLYLRVYETHRSINSYLDEPKMQRKPYFRKKGIRKCRKSGKKSEPLEIWQHSFG